MNTPAIIHYAERLYTLTKRSAVSDDQYFRRAEIVDRFQRLATILGKVTTKIGPTDWQAVQERVVSLHAEAVHADERRQATFVHAGSEAALVTSLHAFAAAMGFTLADAATAPVDRFEDDAAMAAVEHREAGE